MVCVKGRRGSWKGEEGAGEIFHFFFCKIFFRRQCRSARGFLPACCTSSVNSLSPIYNLRADLTKWFKIFFVN